MALQLLCICKTEGCSVPYVVVPIGVYHRCFLSLVVATMASTQCDIVGIWRDGEFTARWVAGLAEDLGIRRVGIR